MEREFLFLPQTIQKLEEVKFEVAREVHREMMCLRISQKRIAQRLGTSQPIVSRVANRKVKELTLSQLFRFLAILNPEFRILISPR